MYTAATLIAIWRRLRLANIKTMGHAGRQTKEVAHYRFPFTTVGFQTRSMRQVKHQPVGHLMGDHLIEKRYAVFTQQHRVQAYAAAAQVRLPSRGAAQIKPYRWLRQPRAHLKATPPGLLDANQRGLM